MKNLINTWEKNNQAGFVGVEAAIVSALVVIFALSSYIYLHPSFVDIAIAIKNSISGTY